MGEWQLALTIFGSVLATLGLARLVSRDLLEGIKNEFAEAEKRHLEASALWKERLEIRDEKILALAKAVEAIMTAHNACVFRSTSFDAAIVQAAEEATRKFVSKEAAVREREKLYQEIVVVSARIDKLEKQQRDQ
jgi:hypothetical protein